jgi:hypothetical protein
MSTIWELLFERANRRLRRLGVLGVLIGLPVIVYVEIPVETAAIQSELQSIGRTVVHNIHENQQKAQGRERRERHAAR